MQLSGGYTIIEKRIIAFGISTLALCLLLASMTAYSLDDHMNTNRSAVATTSDENGAFGFDSLPQGIYNLTAYKLILGSMHYLGTTMVSLTGNTENVTIKVSRSDEVHFAAFNNTSIEIAPGQFNLSGVVIGPSRPGAAKNETTYDEATVKITSFIHKE